MRCVTGLAVGVAGACALSLAATATARAGTVDAVARYGWSDSQTGTFPNATTYVGGFVNNGAVQDPVGAFGQCNDNGWLIFLRLWGGVNVNVAQAAPPFFGTSRARATYQALANNRKRLTASVTRAVTHGCAVAVADDPWTFSPEPFSRTLEYDWTLESLLMQSEPGEMGKSIHSGEVMIGGTLIDLYDLEIGMADGGGPMVNLMVHPYAAGQGWNQASLQASLLAGLTPTGNPGEWMLSSNFTFPTLTFNLPAGAVGSLLTDLQSGVTPAPATLSIVAALGLLGAPRRRR